MLLVDGVHEIRKVHPFSNKMDLGLGEGRGKNIFRTGMPHGCLESEICIISTKYLLSLLILKGCI